MIRLLWITMLLVGCASNPLPEAPTTVRVTPPASLLGGDPEPAPPDPDAATQRDVADYLNDLSAWGQRGWARVREIKSWSDAQ